MKDTTLKTPLLSFDFAATLIGKKAQLDAEQQKNEPKKVRKMAVKKAHVPVKVTVAKPPPPKHANVRRNWKTEDQQLDFELSFDADGDTIVDVVDADYEETPIGLALGLGGLDEVITILQEIRAAAARIEGGTILPEDTIVEDEEEEEEDDDEEEEEEEDDDD